MPATIDPYHQEVLDLHVYLTLWLTGEIPNGDGTPARLKYVLADDFFVIHPNGQSGSKADAIESFGKAWGEKPQSYAIRIENVQTRPLGDDYCLATYKESHVGEPGRERIATAVLERELTSGAIKWRFLQETPLP